MAIAKRKDYLKTTSATAGEEKSISEVEGTSIRSRAFIIQNQDDVNLMVGKMIVPVGAERVYADLEGGGTDALWDSEEILVSSGKVSHQYAVEYFEFER